MNWKNVNNKKQRFFYKIFCLYLNVKTSYIWQFLYFVSNTVISPNFLVWKFIEKYYWKLWWRAVPTKIRHHLLFLYDTKVFFVRHKTFLINATHIYIQQKPFFCKYVFSFCATLNVFSQRESSFGCHIYFFVATTYFFVTHIILVRNVNFYVKYFFCWHNIFLCNTTFFVPSNVSIKNMVNKEKQMCSY